MSVNTLSEITVRELANSDSSYTIEVTGVLESDLQHEVLTDVDSWAVPCHLRLESVQHAIQDKLTCLLWWEHKEGDDLLFPLAGRGVFPAKGSHIYTNPHKGHSGNVVLTTTGVGKEPLAFSLVLDFSKKAK